MNVARPTSVDRIRIVCWRVAVCLLLIGGFLLPELAVASDGFASFVFTSGHPQQCVSKYERCAGEQDLLAVGQ
jgi:hypothetical protein